MIKVIFFDVGGVYIIGALEEVLINMANGTGVEKEKVKAVVMGYLIKFQEGKMSDNEFCDSVAKKIGTDPETVEQLWEAEEIFEINDDVDSIIRKLKENYSVSAITDVEPILARKNREKGTYDVFDFVMTSVEAKATKMSKKIYLLALERAKAKPEECIMIDDKEEKLVAAKELGMKTIHFENAEKLKKDLRNLDVRI